MPAAASSLAELRVALRRAGVPLAPASSPTADNPTSPEALRRRRQETAPTGIAALDELIGGGLPRGRITELGGARSTGRTALALSALGAATARGEMTALVDVGGALDVERARAAEIDFARLLWARAADARQGAQAADLVLAAGGFGLVVLDLGEAPPRLPDASWVRLGRAAEKAGTALLVLAPPSRGTAQARMKSASGSSVNGATNGGARSVPAVAVGAALHLEASRPRAPKFAALSPASPRVLVSLPAEWTVTRARHGGEGGTTTVELRLR